MEEEDNHYIELLKKIKDNTVKEYLELSKKYDILQGIYTTVSKKWKELGQKNAKLQSKIKEYGKENNALKKKLASLHASELISEENQCKEREQLQKLKERLQSEQTILNQKESQLANFQSELDQQQHELLMAKDGWKREKDEILEKQHLCQEQLNQYLLEENQSLWKSLELSEKLGEYTEKLGEWKCKCEQYQWEIKRLEHELKDTTKIHYDIVEAVLIREALDSVAVQKMSLKSDDIRGEVWRKFFSKTEHKSILEKLKFHGDVKVVVDQIFQAANKNIHDCSFKPGMKVYIREDSFSSEQRKLIKAAWIIGDLPKGTLILIPALTGHVLH